MGCRIMGAFKVGMRGSCVICKKPIVVMNQKHKYCKECAKKQIYERGKRSRMYRQNEIDGRKERKPCKICGEKFLTFSAEGMVCDFCNTYTIEWGSASGRKKYTIEFIKAEKERLRQMANDSIKRFANLFTL